MMPLFENTRNRIRTAVIENGTPIPKKDRGNSEDQKQ